MMDRNKVTPFNTGPKMTSAIKLTDEKLTQNERQVMDRVQGKPDFLVGHLSDVDTGNIKVHMLVIASCGKKVGVVDGIEGQAIKLTKLDSNDNRHHFIPLGWVASVDNAIHLNRNSGDTEREWTTAAAG